MLNTKSFLAVDFGAGSLKLAEFDVNEAGGLRLRQYGMKSLGAEGAQESSREAAILKALQGLIADRIGIHHAFILPVLCYLYIAVFGMGGTPQQTVA